VVRTSDRSEAKPKVVQKVLKRMELKGVVVASGLLWKKTSKKKKKEEGREERRAKNLPLNRCKRGNGELVLSVLLERKNRGGGGGGGWFTKK